MALEVGELHLEHIQAGGYLLYRRPKNGSAGNWMIRWYDAKTRRQRQGHLGIADDFTAGDNFSVFSYEQAVLKAEAWFKGRTRLALLAECGEVVPEGPYTVADAMRDYVTSSKRRGMKGYLICEQTINAHVIPSLGDLPVERLTRARLEAWHLAIAESPRRKTGKVKEETEYLEAPITDEAKRKRKNTANRILTILKAGLNHALETGKVLEPAPWRFVKPFKGVIASRMRYLSIAEQRKLVTACEGDFKALVQAALFTGARYGELTRLRVQDYHAHSGTVFIETSKNGKPRHVFLTEEAKAWFQEITEGRDTCDLLLRRENVLRTKRKGLVEEEGWAPYDQVYCMHLACEAARIQPLTFHELRHTYASALVNSGISLAYVAAQLGHTGTRMVERFYGHLCPSAQAEAIRSLAPKLGITDISKVQPLTLAGA